MSERFELPDVSASAELLVRRLRRADLDALPSWGHHTDPLFTDYNVPALRDIDLDAWWYSFNGDPSRILYAGILDGRLIAQLTLRAVDRVQRSADFGISMDPRYVNAGFGTRFITQLLNIAFDELQLDRVTLDVAGYNRRAVKAYVSCGFIETARSWMQLDTRINFRDLLERSEYAWLKEWVRIEDGVVRFVVLAMEARRSV